MKTFFKENIGNFLKGIMVGLGAVAPGLSGSILLVIFGLYQKTIQAISTIFKHFVKNLKFLIPLGAGIGIGIIAFSKLVDFLLGSFQMQTRFAFFGLILGSIPLFWQEVRKNGYKNKYYILVALALGLGLVLFNVNKDMFPRVTEPNLLQCVVLGVAVAASYIVPGIDSAALLSALGLYELWVSSLASLDFAVLLPALVGAGCGVLVVSFIINKLIARFYTPTFSVIFGLFLATIPAVFNESCVLGWNGQTYISIALMAVCFAVSLCFSNLERIKERINPKKGEV